MTSVCYKQQNWKWVCVWVSACRGLTQRTTPLNNEKRRNDKLIALIVKTSTKFWFARNLLSRTRALRHEIRPKYKKDRTPPPTETNKQQWARLSFCQVQSCFTRIPNDRSAFSAWMNACQTIHFQLSSHMLQSSLLVLRLSEQTGA